MSEKGIPPLRTKVLRGLSWSMLQTWGTHLITLGVFLVTARLLGPEAFGTVAIAYAIMGALIALIDLGMGDALIRSRDAGQEHFDTVFWALMGLSVVLVIVLAMTSHWIALAFDQPELELLMRVVALSLPVTAAGMVPAVILRRSLHFKPLALRSLAASIVGGAVAIVLALAGFGYWALVVKGLVEPIVAGILVWMSAHYRPGLTFVPAIWNELFATGRHLLGSRLVDIVNQRADALIVSARLGPAPLGLYSAAQRIYHSMMDAMFMAIQRVALPAFAQIAHDPPRVQQALLRMVRLTSFVTFPLFAMVGLLADLLIPVLFGERWADAAPALSALCAGGVLFSVSYYNAPLMTATGRPEFVFRLTLLNTTLNLVAFLVGVQWGIVGVAIGYAARGYLVFPINLALLRRAVGLAPRRYLATVGPTLAATLVTALLTGLAAQFAPLPANAALRLLALAAGAILLHAAVLLLGFRPTLGAVLLELESMSTRAPRIASILRTLHRWIAPRKP
jgi:PST family polysaccharide transporter